MSNHTKSRSNKRLVALLAVAVVGMFGFGYALVPLYDIFCEITGIGGKPAIAESLEAPPKVASLSDRSMKIEFTGTAAENLSWQIEPANTETVNLGAVTVVDYRVKNLSSREITGQAVPSVAPQEGARHLVKIECFCFTEQHLAAGEEKLMPVRFYVDPSISEDIKTLTLSYSFYDVSHIAKNHESEKTHDSATKHGSEHL